MKSSANENGKCIVCESVLDNDGVLFENMPLGAQVMPTIDTLLYDKGIDLRLVTCKKCGLTQFDTTPVDYYKKAIRVVGLSDYMKKLRYDDFKYIDENFGLDNKKIIEVGCGNGDFLYELIKYNSNTIIYGTCEDDDNILKARKKLGAKASIIKYFPENCNELIPNAPFDYFLSFNFLEHQPYPKTMLKVIYNSLRDGGIGLITVPSFEYIIKKSVYYELIRDHIANYDIDSLKFLLNSVGFEVINKGFISIGDTIRLIVKKNNNKCSFANNNINKKKYDINVLKESYTTIKTKIEKIVKVHRDNNKTIALWGAGHQGFTILATTALRDFAKYIIDSSSEKVGKYSPVSHIKIVKPEYFFTEKVDTIFIVAPAYINEIRNSIKNIIHDSINVIDILTI